MTPTMPFQSFTENKSIALSLSQSHKCPDCQGPIYEYQESIPYAVVRNQGTPQVHIVNTTGPPVLIKEFVCFSCGFYFSTSLGFRVHPEQFKNMFRYDPAWQKDKALEALFKNCKRVYPP